MSASTERSSIAPGCSRQARIVSGVISLIIAIVVSRTTHWQKSFAACSQVRRVCGDHRRNSNLSLRPA
ncbi:MAG TPA: hypothetical protein VNL91_00655 [Thermoanaerobaculia bacterium]|nr:hypothetical protein [Thermoanaerobaculia bacterium]